MYAVHCAHTLPDLYLCRIPTLFLCSVFRPPLSLFSFDQLPILPISMLCTLYPIISSHSNLGERKTEGWEERNCFFIIKQSLRRLKCKSFCQENVCWDKVSSWGQNILDIIFAFLLINDIRNILYFPNRLNIF